MHMGTMTSKGQVTLPKELRDLVNFETGDKLIFNAENGEIRIRKPERLSDLAGMLHRPGRRPVSIEKMKKSVADAVNRESR
ncbi:MAG: AbrB/MazE/SpoVT family DNA-binding domain-containing protein [Candidatus Omnitrophica bacterium]|nr:AbrB/MazE/SpoVT family DNA-binding domain-containing protein [Candidatus Omnitrophota bacterium]